LLGMKERLEMVGGSFAVTSAPGKGTTILAQVPLMKSRMKRGGGGGAREH
jgi:signal transduction histidine kinase